MATFCEDLWILLVVVLKTGRAKVVVLLLGHQETRGGGTADSRAQTHLLHAASRGALSSEGAKVRRVRAGMG